MQGEAAGDAEVAHPRLVEGFAEPPTGIRMPLRNDDAGLVHRDAGIAHQDGQGQIWQTHGMETWRTL